MRKVNLKSVENRSYLALINDEVEYFRNGELFNIADYTKLSPAEQRAFDNLSDSFADGELFYAETDDGEFAYDKNPWNNPVWNCRAEVVKKVYNDVDTECDTRFPLYCREHSSYKAYILIDTESGSVWADTQDSHSCSERIWKGRDVRFSVRGDYFDSWDTVRDWVDEHLDIILDYLNNDVSEDKLHNTFYDDCCSEYSVYDDFSEYTNNYSMRDLIAELESADYSCLQYAEDLQDTSWSNCYFAGYAETKTLADDIYDYFKEHLDEDDDKEVLAKLHK